MFDWKQMKLFSRCKATLTLQLLLNVFIFILSLQLMWRWQKTVLFSMISNLWTSTWRRKHMSRRRGRCTDRRRRGLYTDRRRRSLYTDSRWAEPAPFSGIQCWLRLLLRLVFMSVRRQQGEWSQRDGGYLTQERPHPRFVNTWFWLKRYDPNYNMNATPRYSEAFLSFRGVCGKSMTLMLLSEEINPLNQVIHTPQCFYSPQHCQEYSNITCMSKQSDNRCRFDYCQ